MLIFSRNPLRQICDPICILFAFPLVEAYKAARPNKEQREKKEWFETQCSNQDRQGLAGERIREWDRGLVNRMLAEV